MINYSETSNHTLRTFNDEVFTLYKLTTIFNLSAILKIRAFPDGTVVKNPPANAGDTEDMGSVPGWGRSPGGGMATYSCILAGENSWTEEPGGPQPMGSQRAGCD